MTQPQYTFDENAYPHLAGRKMKSNPDTLSACPHCANTCNHTPAGHPTGYAVWECQRCGAFSTLEQLQAAEQRVNGRDLETA